MSKIKLYDYTVTDDWGWQTTYYIGQGTLTAAYLVPQIEATPDGEDITVQINTVGGYIDAGWVIYNALIDAKSRGCKIITRIEGFACSIGSIIAMAGDEVVMCQASIMMVHKPSTCGWCFPQNVDADFLTREADALNKLQAVLNVIYQTRTGLDAATIDSMVNAETWITPSEALQLGFATSIDGVFAAKVELAEEVFNQVFQNVDPKTRSYVNSSIKINKTMNIQEALKNNADAMKQNTSTLAEVKTFLNKLIGGKPKNADEEVIVVDDTTAATETALADGTSIFHDGTLNVETEVFTDEALTTHVTEGTVELADGNSIVVDAAGLVTELIIKEADSELIEDLKAENAALAKALNAATVQLNKTNATLTKLKNTSSKFVPKEDTTDFSASEKLKQDKGPMSYADIKANKENRNKKTNK